MIQQILPEELYKKITNGETISVIDVREDDEVAQGMIPRAKHIPLGELENRLNELDKETEHIMVCRSGARSTKACQIMLTKGFKVKNMVGGMISWEAKYGKSMVVD
ncbi:Rhodanese-related sulfurtransferase [Heyndrickxia coagulans DSM 1 = ATCC 7050]|uniref:Rhodanese-related sulfurtransferase n=2 Tax=Bacillota TaxID=1239 RepID=A0A8B4BXM1_HEYCO|nr:Rhodanese-related sulfurtransferase [Heyndrickxia coagulans DSM 1 = ATCC 7050]